MQVFANEGNVSQDANFRAHLDDNWNSGNREFDKIEGLLNTLEEDLSDYRDEIHQLQDDYRDEIHQLKLSFNNLKEQHTNDFDDLTKQINELNETVKKQDARISKLEKAVFGLAPADITTPPTPDYPNSGMVEVNFDDRKDKKDKW